MQDTEYYSMMRNQYHNNDWEKKLAEKLKEKSKPSITLPQSNLSESNPIKDSKTDDRQ